MKVRELAELLGAAFEGDGEKELDDVASLEAAGASQLAFVGSRQAARQADSSSAGCLIVPPDFPTVPGRTVIRAPEPRTAFAGAAARLHPRILPEPGVHPTAVIGEDTRIGEGTSIGPGCVVGSRVVIGENCILHANVTVYDDVEIGARVELHSGCVIGADGFGFVQVAGRHHKFPQIGRVSIGDDVEIGANSCVDRSALGVTSIGEGTKLDNMVHVAHNCRIGRHVLVAAQTGISGSAEVGDYAVIAGQVGIADKVRIEPGVIVGAQAGVPTSKILRAGQVYWGTPARPIKELLESLANLSRLPEMRQELAELKRKVASLEE